MTAESESTLDDAQSMTMGELGRAIIRIERKLDGAMDDHEKRLRQLERWMWGAVAVGGAGLASGVGALFSSGGLG